MNISFNTSKIPKKIIDPIKEQINIFKLKTDDEIRYLTDIEIFEDDNVIICNTTFGHINNNGNANVGHSKSKSYTEDYQISITYKESNVIDVECLSDEFITKELKSYILFDKSISENLININKFFIDNDKDDESLKSASSLNRFNNFFESKSLSKEIIFENDNESIISSIETSSDDDDNDNFIKEVKPVKFDLIINPKKIVPDLYDEIILYEVNQSNNLIPFDIINNSKKLGKNSTVNQIINEINYVIKTLINVKLIPINSVFELSINNKFNDGEFNYNLNIPINYPFIPPTISVKSICNQSFVFALNNCEILNESKWNPSTTLNDIINGIYNNINRIGYNNILINISSDVKFVELSNNLLKLTNCEPLNYKNFNLNFDFLKIQDKKDNKGIGYDHSGPTWDINAYIKEQIEKNKKITNILLEMIPLISTNKIHLNESCLIPYIKQYIYDVSLLEVEKKKKYYEVIFQIFSEIYKLGDYNTYFNINKVCEQREIFADYPIIQMNIPILEIVKEEINKQDYVSVMKELVFDSSNIIKNRKFKFIEQSDIKTMSVDLTKRINAEIKNLRKNLPISETSSIFVRTDDTNITILKFLVIPHPDTPYAYGCFEFDMYLPYNYPHAPPHIEIITTGNGQVRFNPNLYADGKVCLSLLGTWRGTGGETWNSNSTILQVLLSIQSLIFCEEPYFNEPGYEKDRGNTKGKEANNSYNEPIRHQTMKLGMLDQLKCPSFGFEEVIKNHFRLKKNDIYQKLDEWQKIAKNKTQFETCYKELKTLIEKL